MLIRKIKKEIKNSFQCSEHLVIIYGLYSLLGFAFFYFFNETTVGDGTYNNASLRIIACTLSLFLILKNYWPAKTRVFLPYFWHLTLCYNLPFFFSVMLFHNTNNAAWQMYGLLSLCILLLLVRWFSFIAVTIVGILSGFVFYYFTLTTFNMPQVPAVIWFNYLIFVSYFIVFRKKEQESCAKNTEKIEHLIANTIAHEMRTSLGAISLGSEALKRQLTPCIEGYQAAKDANLPIAPLSKTGLQSLQELPEELYAMSKKALTTIDMLLTNLKKLPKKMDFKECSLSQCIHQAFSEYLLNKEDQAKIKWVKGDDIVFHGNERFVVHILFNLLKNALYHVYAANKGDITLWIERGEKFDEFHFKDTGEGISKEVLPHIFERFYTKTDQGSGIGLAFCKTVMTQMGGDIVCFSKENQFTEFILYFPKITSL